ncbi:MAG: CBS domain-containing protein [Metallosphaera sp.]|uniref:CBS domain-containing protein n=1 Tax=Metallosphaera sp. TaxID=2020860 RepID=UPI0031632E53
MIKVSEVMSPIVVSVSPESEIRELLSVLSKDRSGRVLVMRDGKPEAIVTTRSVVHAYVKYGKGVTELKTKDLMSESLVSVAADASLDEVLRIMIAHDIGGVPVMDEGVVVGMFTERDLVKLMSRRTYSGLVDSIMTGNLVTIEEDADIFSAARVMTEHKVRRLPILKNDKLVGIVTAADIVKSLSKSTESIPVIRSGTMNPLTVRSLDTIMYAVKIMEERRIGTLPVVDDKLRGIITERDLLFAALNSF